MSSNWKKGPLLFRFFFGGGIVLITQLFLARIPFNQPVFHGFSKRFVCFFGCFPRGSAVIFWYFIPRKLAAGALLGSWFVDRCFSFYQADFLGPGHNKIQSPRIPDTGRSIKSLEGQKIYDIYYWEEVQLGRGRAFGYSIDTSSKKILKPGDSLNQTYMIIYIMIKVVRARTPSCCLKLQ